LAVLVFAAATRVTYMLSKSLVLDEFHSYFHATAQGWEGLMAGLLRDNHPPLTFLVIGAAGAALGTAEWALRSPAFLMGLVEIALVASIAGGLNRRLGSRAGSAAPVWAAAILSASSLHFDYGTQVRMYAFLALFVTISTYALLILLERDDRPETSMKGPATAFALAATAAFHSHYFAVQYIGTLSAAFLLLALLTGRRRALRAFAASAGAAVLLSGPWALTGFRHQLTHALPPGGDDVSIKALAEGFVQLFFHNVRFGGPLRLAFIAGAGLVLWIALRGVYLGVRERQVRTPILLLAASAFAVPVLSWALAALQPRAGFTWHYVLPSAAPAAILFALGARGRLASAVAGIALLLAATLTCMHLARPATEDFRGAVEFALKTHGHTPSEEVSRIVSVEWQPALFPQGQPYDYYAPRLATGPAPEREPMLVGEFTVAKMDRLTSADRVIVVRRSLPDDQHLLRHLTQAFPQRSITAFGFGVDVHVFTR
jgi:4-amino-4-deoxy-L-arabinose transferase-like glycosyltransferase